MKPLLVFFRASVLKNTLENTELFYKKPPESSCMLIKEKNEEPLKVLVKKMTAGKLQSKNKF